MIGGGVKVHLHMHVGVYGGSTKRESGDDMSDAQKPGLPYFIANQINDNLAKNI